MKAFHSASLTLSLLLAACGSSDDKRVIVDDDADTSDGWGGGNVNYDSNPGADFGDGNGTTLVVPPDFASPCEGNSDCSSGICYQNGSLGNICTISCYDGCPTGFSCLAVNMGSDVSYVCVPRPNDGSDTSGDGNGDGGNGDSDGNTIEPNPTDTFISDDSETSDGSLGDSDGGLGDDTGTDTPDTTNPSNPNGTACDAPPGVGSDILFTENGDWADCVATGCANILPASSTVRALDLRGASTYTGARGMLDNLSHSYEFRSGMGSGPDIDIVAILAEPRTMLEFAVIKEATSALIDPVVAVSDGFATRTYNSDVSDSNSCARTTFAYPYVSGLPIYVTVEDAINYDLYTPNGYAGTPVGGAGYGWILRVRKSPFQPVELGNHPLNGTISFEDKLNLGGETRYYRFYAPGTARPKVRLTPVTRAPFVPFLAGINTIGGQLVWERTAQPGSDGNVSLPGGSLKACNRPEDCSGGSCFNTLCSSDAVEFIFAVADFNGASPGAGGFNYRISIELTSN